MEVPNYINNKPIYGPVTNGTGTAATAIVSTAPPCNYSNIPSQSYTYSKYPSIIDAYTSENVINYLSQTIKELKEEKETLKTRVELLEIQFKFALNKLTEMEKFLESRK